MLLPEFILTVSLFIFYAMYCDIIGVSTGKIQQTATKILPILLVGVMIMGGYLCQRTYFSYYNVGAVFTIFGEPFHYSGDICLYSWSLGLPVLV